MVEIVAGAGLGLERTSGWLLGSRGSLGDAEFARYGENVFVNATTGNLVIERRDEMLFGVGPDSEIDSIYNSQSDTSDDNGDRWRTSDARQVTLLSGTVKTTGSTVQRFAADGSDELYTWDATNSRYVCTQTNGANDTITFKSGVWTWTDGTTQTTETYDNAVSGLITKMTDTDGKSLTYTYTTDANGKNLLSRVTTDDGEYTDFMYTGASGNQLQQLRTTLADGTISRRVIYAYDSMNRLSVVTLDRTPQNRNDSSSVTLTYGYSGNTSRVTSITGDDGSSLVITYQNVGGVYKVASLTQALAGSATAVTSFDYSVANQTKITDPLGQVMTMYYDGSGRLIQLDMPPALAGGPVLTSKFTYASATDNHVTSVKDASGNVTSYGYDTNGNMISVEDAAGDTITRIYDQATNALLIESRYATADDGTNGASMQEITRYVYDAEDHLRYVISALGEVTEYDYNKAGERVSSIIYRDHPYDLSGLNTHQAPIEATMVAWAGGLGDLSTVERVDMTYDPRGNLWTSTSYSACLASGAGDMSATSIATTYVYSQAGQLLSRQTGDQNTVTFLYDGLFRLTSSTDLNGNVMTIGYQDTACQQVVSYSATGLIQTSTYDLAGRLINVARSGSGVAAAAVSYRYDADGQLRMVTDASGNKSYFVYDADGRKVADVAADGAVTEYGYDKSGRLIYTLAYATRLSSNKLAAMVDANGNPKPLTLSAVQPARDDMADLWSWRVYDKADRLVETVDGIGSVVQYSYDGESRLIGTTAYYNRLTTSQLSGFRSSGKATLTAPTAAANGVNGPWDEIARNFYDKDGRLVGVLDPRGYLTQTIYNAAGETIETVAYADLVPSGLQATGSFTSILASVAGNNDPRDQHIRYFYDDEGMLRFAVAANLQTTGYVYNGAGRLLHTTRYAQLLNAPNGSNPWTLAFVSNQVSSNGRDLEDDPANRVTYSVYDATGHEVYRIDPTGMVTQFTYDGSGRIIKAVQFACDHVQTPPIGDKTRTAWDNWASSHADSAFPDNRTTRSYYDATGRLAYTVDGESYVTAYGYDLNDRVTSEVRYADQVAVTDATTTASLKLALPGQVPATAQQSGFSYDVDGRLTDRFDGLGIYTHYSYDAQGRLTDQTLAFNTSDAATTHYDYDLAGNVQAKTWASGMTEKTTTTYTYDGEGNVLTATDGIDLGGNGGTTTTYTYDQMGRVLTTTRPDSGTTRSDYDAFGNMIRVQNALGNVTVSTYDSLDRLIWQVDAEGYVTGTTYGFGNEIASVTRYYNRASQSGAAVVPTVQANSAEDEVTTFARDRLGRLVNVTDAENASEVYKLDAFGDRIEVTNKLNGKTINLFDHRGLLIQETLPVTATDSNGNQIAVVNTFGYDARGNLISKVEAVGLPEVRTTTYKYDVADRLTDTIHDDLVPIVGTDLKARPSVKQIEHLDYDSRGNLVASTDTLGNKTVFFYDDLNRKIAQVDPTLALSTWTYYGTGNVHTATVYGDRLTSMPPGRIAPDPVDPNNFRQTSYSYDGSGRLLNVTVKDIMTGSTVNGVYVTTSGSVTDSADNDLVTSTTYDAAGNVTSQTDAQGGVSYFYYDKAGHKIGQVDAGRYLTAFDVDEDGNVTKETRYAMAIPGSATIATTSTMAYLKGRITANGAQDRVTDFEYDRDGRRTAEVREGVQYWTLDANHQPVLHTGNARIEYQYNGLGEVVSKKEATSDTTTYGYDALGRQTSVTGPSTLYWKAASPGSWVTGARQTVNAYDGLNDLISTTVRNTNASAGDVARTTYFSYGAGGRLASTTDAAGFTRSYSYDAAGRVLMESWTRLKSDLVQSHGVTEANVYRYDAAGRVTMQGMASKNADGSWTFGEQTRMKYDAFGEVVARGLSADPTGADPTSAYAYQELYDYDAAGRVWRSEDEGSTKFYLYDKNGNQTLEISSAGTDLWGKTLEQALAAAKGSGSSVGSAYVAGVNAAITIYDARNQATGTQMWRDLDATTHARASSTRAYDAFGEVVQDVDALGHATDYGYNTLGKLIQTQGPATDWTDEQGVQHSGRAVQNAYYDISGRLIGTWVATGNRDAQGNYDTLGNMNTRTLLAGTGYGGDEAVVLNEYHADGGVFQNRYDVFGDRRISLDEVGKAESYVYDAMDRLIEQDHQPRTDGTPQLKDYYGYDGLGERTRHWNSQYLDQTTHQPTQLETTDYDLQGRVSSMVDLGGNATSYSYRWNGDLFTSGLGIYGGWVKTTTDASGRTASETTDYFGHLIAHTDYGGHVYDYTFDKAGRLVKTTNTLVAGDGYSTTTKGEVDYAWYDTGLVKTVSGGTLPSGGTFAASAVTSYGYDLLGERTLEKYTVGGVVKENATVAYDAAGRMKSFDDVSADDGHTVSIDWAYDRVGNVRNMTASYWMLNYQGDAYQPGPDQNYWYKYDAMNRFTTVKGVLVNGQIVRGSDWTSLSGGTGGADIAYDKAGNRVSVTRTVTGYFPGGSQYQIVQDSYEEREDYSYTADGYLQSVRIADGARQGSGSTLPAAPATGAVRATYVRDAMGRVSDYTEYKDPSAGGGVEYVRHDDYDARNQVTEEKVTTLIGSDTYYTDTVFDYQAASGAGQYNGAYQGGIVTHSRATTTKNGTGATTTDTVNSFLWWEGADQLQIDYTSSGATTHSYYHYDALGHIGSVNIDDGRRRDVSFVTDGSGTVLQRDEQDYNTNGTVNTTTGDPRELYFYFAGTRVGDVSNNGTSDTDYVVSLGAHLSQGTGGFRGGATTGVAYADFDQAYEPINGLNYDATSSRYTVQSGDTLQSIAQTVWGDSSLWYMIADANGLDGSETLAAGRDLIIPNKVHNVHNTSDVYRVYDPNDTIGNTSPTVPKPTSGPHGNNCGVFGQILEIVVAVAVVAILHLPPVTSLLTAAEAAGGGALASIASQTVGIAVGAQDGFSFKAVALSAIGAVAGGALGKGGILGGKAGAFSDVGSKFVQGALRSATGNVLTQGIALATGLQHSFDWAGVAAGAAIGGVESLFPNVGGLGIDHYATRAVSGAAAAIAGSAARSLIDGSDFGDNILGSLPDVVGATVGEALGDRVAAIDAARHSETASLGTALSNLWHRATQLGSEVRSDFRTDLDEIVVEGRRYTDSFLEHLYAFGSLAVRGLTASFGYIGDSALTQANTYQASGNAVANGAAALNNRYHIVGRSFGALRTIGGIAEAGSGAALTGAGITFSEIGVGIPVAAGGVVVMAHGLDQVQAGVRGVMTGGAIDSFTSAGLQRYAGFSPGSANGVDAGVGVVASGGATLGTIALRQATAKAFYESSGWSADRIKYHLRGIDFTGQVYPVTLGSDDTVMQFAIGGKPGNYFAPVGTAASELGINPAGRTAMYFSPTGDVVVLRSTARSIIDDWTDPLSPYQAEGGGTQYFTGDPSLFYPAN